MLPQVDFCGRRVSRLICGGNPLIGCSHVSAELDREMIDVGMFQKHKNQVEENSRLVREILEGRDG